MYLRRRRPAGGRVYRVSEAARAMLQNAGAESPRRIGQLLAREGYVTLCSNDSCDTVLIYSVQARRYFVCTLERSTGLLGNAMPAEDWSASTAGREVRAADKVSACERALSGFAGRIDRSMYLTPEMSAQFT